MVAVPSLVFRSLRSDDRQALAGFACSTDTDYENEVEQWIRTKLVSVHERLVSEVDFRTTVATVGEEIVAVGAHHVTDFRSAAGPFDGTKIVVLAVRLDFQGVEVVVPGGRRASAGAAMLSALLEEIVGLPRGRAITAEIDRANARSIGLFDRAGFRIEHPVLADASLIRRIWVAP